MKRKQRQMIAMFTILMMLFSLITGCGSHTPNVPAASSGEVTEEPTTEASTTEELTTEEPTTEEPTTEEPATEVPTTEEPTTEAPKTMDIHTEEVQIAGEGIVQIFDAGTTVLADLNGDGEAEKITVQLYPDKEYDEQFAVQIEDAYCDAEAFRQIVGYTEGLVVGKIYLIDLDTSDQWLEVAFYASGSSMDPVTTFLRYDDGEIIRVGSVPVWPPVLEPDNYSRLEVTGDGTASGRTQYDVVQTQFVTMCWELKNSSEFRATLEENVPEYYSFQLRNDPNNSLYLRQDATFYKDMNAAPDNLITLPKDTVVDIGRYYPESGWIQVIYEQGTKAVWLLMDGNEMLQPLNVHRWSLGAYVVGLAVAD